METNQQIQIAFIFHKQTIYNRNREVQVRFISILKISTDPIAVMKNQSSTGFSRSQSEISSKQSLDNVTTINSKHAIVKQKSQCALVDYSKHLRQVTTDTDARQRRRSIGDVVSGQDLFESSNSGSPKVRVSSGSFFYGQVVAQQQLHAIQNPIKKARPVEKIRRERKIQKSFSCAFQVRDFFDRSTQQVIFFIVFCQLFVSVHLYYLIMTLKCKVCV